MNALWINNASESDPRSYEVQRKPRKHYKDPPVRHSTNWAVKPGWKQVKSEFSLYLLYEENDMMCIW